MASHDDEAGGEDDGWRERRGLYRSGYLQPAQPIIHARTFVTHFDGIKYGNDKSPRFDIKKFHLAAR